MDIFILLLLHFILVKKGKEQRYCWTEEESDAAVKEIGKQGKDNVGVQRYKGLG